jgi:hypothetical protein
MTKLRGVLALSIAIAIFVPTLSAQSDPSRFAGVWTMTTEGDRAKVITIEQTGKRLKANVVEDSGYIHFKGSTSGKKSFVLESVDVKDQIIRVSGSIDQDGMISGSMIISDSVGTSAVHSRPSTSTRFIALRKE